MKSKKFLNSISKILTTRGFQYVELDTVIPLDYINKKTSDNFRNSMFAFTNKNNEFALRSDLSVMSLLKYVESGSKKKKNGGTKERFLEEMKIVKTPFIIS